MYEELSPSLFSNRAYADELERDRSLGRREKEGEEGGEIACHYIFTSISLLYQIDR
jgi:hypothetical protein